MIGVPVLASLLSRSGAYARHDPPHGTRGARYLETKLQWTDSLSSQRMHFVTLVAPQVVHQDGIINNKGLVFMVLSLWLD